MTAPINERYLPNCPKPPQRKQSWKLKLKANSKILLLVILILILIIPKGMDIVSNNSHSTNYFTQSIGTYEFDDSGQSIIKTIDHGFAIAGYTWSYGNGKSDMWLVKVNSQGNVQWNTTFGGSEIDRAFSLVQTSDQGFVLGGETHSFSYSDSAILIAKFSYQGELLWHKLLDNPENEVCYDVIEDTDSNIVLTGFSESDGNKDIKIIKLSSLGDLLWQYEYGGELDDIGYSIVQTSDNGYVISGVTWSYGLGNSDAILLKVNEKGTILWNSTYGSENREWAMKVINTNDGGLAISGSSWAFGNDYRDMLLVKTNDLGEQEWSLRLGGAKKESAEGLVQCSDGGYLLAGYSVSPIGTINSDIILYKTSDSGRVEWNKSYGGKEHDLAFSVIKNDNKGFLITGIIDAPWVYPYYGGGNMIILSVDTEGNFGNNLFTEDLLTIDIHIQAIIGTIIIIYLYKLSKYLKSKWRPNIE